MFWEHKDLVKTEEETNNVARCGGVKENRHTTVSGQKS